VVLMSGTDLHGITGWASRVPAEAGSEITAANIWSRRLPHSAHAAVCGLYLQPHCLLYTMHCVKTDNWVTSSNQICGFGPGVVVKALLWGQVSGWDQCDRDQSGQCTC